MDHKKFEREASGWDNQFKEGIMEWVERVLEMIPDTIKEIQKRLTTIEEALQIKK